MDETYLLVAARYIELNPVRAGLAVKPGDYQWSSASVHLTEKDDDQVNVSPRLERTEDWKDFLSDDVSEQERDDRRQYEKSGRPLGSEHFVPIMSHL